MTKGFSDRQEFFITAMMTPSDMGHPLLAPPAITLGVADSDKLKDLNLGSFPST